MAKNAPSPCRWAPFATPEKPCWGEVIYDGESECGEAIFYCCEGHGRFSLLEDDAVNMAENYQAQPTEGTPR